MKLFTGEHYIPGVAILFELTDEQLEIVRDNKNYYLDTNLVNEFYKSKGDNAHVCGLFNNGDGAVVYSALKKLVKEDYKSVSWWDREIEEFKIVRREVCP